MTKTYCDLCSIECKEYKEEYQLPQEFYFDLGTPINSTAQVYYTPCTKHLCQNCAKIIYLFIKGMEKGEINE